MHPIRVDTRPVTPAHARCRRLDRGSTGNCIILARLVEPLFPHRPLEGRSQAFLVDAESPDLCGDRWHRRRPHHVTPGAAGRRAQLGLPLLLAARCDVHADGPGICGLSRRSASVGAMAPAHGGWKPAPAPNNVWLIRRTTAP